MCIFICIAAFQINANPHCLAPVNYKFYIYPVLLGYAPYVLYFIGLSFDRSSNGKLTHAIALRTVFWCEANSLKQLLEEKQCSKQPGETEATLRKKGEKNHSLYLMVV